MPKQKRPIEFALIIIERDTFKKQKYSNQDGEFLFDSILPGVYSISVSFPEYTKQTYQCVQITKKISLVSIEFCSHQKLSIQILT